MCFILQHSECCSLTACCTRAELSCWVFERGRKGRRWCTVSHYLRHRNVLDVSRRERNYCSWWPWRSIRKFNGDEERKVLWQVLSLLWREQRTRLVMVFLRIFHIPCDRSHMFLDLWSREKWLIWFRQSTIRFSVFIVLSAWFNFCNWQM